MSTKSTLRKAALAQRRSLSPWQRRQANAQLQHGFKALYHTHGWHQLGTVHMFVPLASKAEPDTWPLIKWLWQQGHRVVMPVVVEGQLQHAALQQDTVLQQGKFGLEVPATPLWVDSREVELVVVPLLLADRAGNRLGYGQGHYDRFLDQLGPAVPTVGYSLLPPVDHLASEPHDVALQFLLWPQG